MSKPTDPSAVERIERVKNALFVAKARRTRQRNHGFREYLIAQFVGLDDLLIDDIEALLSRLAALETSMGKIDAIRNSIIGCQKVNFSEHVYPLVAALGEAGFEGLDYETNAANVGTLIERTNAAEAKVAALEGALRPFADMFDELEDALDLIDDVDQRGEIEVIFGSMTMGKMPIEDFQTARALLSTTQEQTSDE